MPGQNIRHNKHHHTWHPRGSVMVGRARQCKKCKLRSKRVVVTISVVPQPAYGELDVRHGEQRLAWSICLPGVDDRLKSSWRHVWELPDCTPPKERS